MPVLRRLRPSTETTTLRQENSRLLAQANYLSGIRDQMQMELNALRSELNTKSSLQARAEMTVSSLQARAEVAERMLHVLRKVRIDHALPFAEVSDIMKPGDETSV